jgi:hypothetical protein
MHASSDSGEELSPLSFPLIKTADGSIDDADGRTDGRATISAGRASLHHP